ncbi:Cell division cycle protein [Porphyridium purpureum]|uniref:Cell division cycle protein n=1 Tax=Porphyridium purpureum TaxID=35688 RepID=A0A5J4YXF7_PORPP|nr:Cell division cycle protein [Porphyridium purpureum]|eukprot:POR6916..scf227_4
MELAEWATTPAPALYRPFAALAVPQRCVSVSSRQLYEFLVSNHGVFASAARVQADQAQLDERRRRRRLPVSDPQWEPDSDASGWSSSASSGGSSVGSDTQDEARAPPPDTPLWLDELCARIDRSIMELGGAVCPKLGAVCPVDAAWVMFGRSVCCRSSEDVMLLLKSSDRVAEYLTQRSSNAGDEHSHIMIHLRKWRDMNPGMEFRCIVRDSVLVAVSQRHVDAAYTFLVSERDIILDAICAFFESQLVEIVHRVCLAASRPVATQSFVFDVYVSPSHKVWLVDMEELREGSNLLLFDHEEIDQVMRMANLHVSEEDPRQESDPLEANENRLDELPWFRCVDDATNLSSLGSAQRDALPIDLSDSQALSRAAELAQTLVRAQEERGAPNKKP